MKDELFEEIVKSVRQGGAIMQGAAPPSRKFEFHDTEVKALRKKFGLSQDRFARLLGISPGTLRNWEQGRRRPEGPAQVLLRIASRHPEALLENADEQVSPKKHMESCDARVKERRAAL